jgi:diadenylate cyclase
MWILENLINILKNIQPKDIADIAILSFIIYLFLYIFYRSKILPILISFLIFLFIYLISLTFNLNTTKIFFQFFSNILLIIIIVIFQKELRNLFEKLGLSIQRKNFYKIKIKNQVDNLIKTLKYFSENKIGSLIVLEGEKPLDYFITQGTLLNSDINKEILISIFNKNSPLHDGAVIIDKNKIKKAGVHLPLAENYNFEIKKGTRHRAGVGITEVSDAISLIVSEETGSISVSKNGKLDYQVNEDKLKEILNEYYRIENGFKKDLINYKDIIKYLFLFLLSISISFIFWTSVNYNKAKIQKILEVPVEFKNLKDDLVLKEINLSKIKIIISGYESDLKFLKEENIKFIIDLNEFDIGKHSLGLSSDQIINLPKSIEIINFDPKILKFKITKKEISTTTENKNSRQ